MFREEYNLRGKGRVYFVSTGGGGSGMSYWLDLLVRLERFCVASWGDCKEERMTVKKWKRGKREYR